MMPNKFITGHVQKEYTIFWGNDTCSICWHRGLDLIIEDNNVAIKCPKCSHDLTNRFFSRDLVVDLPNNNLSSKIKWYLRTRCKSDYLRTHDDLVAELFWDPNGRAAEEIVGKMAENLGLDKRSISHNEEVLSSGQNSEAVIVYEYHDLDGISDFSVRPKWSQVNFTDEK